MLIFVSHQNTLFTPSRDKNSRFGQDNTSAWITSLVTAGHCERCNSLSCSFLFFAKLSNASVDNWVHPSKLKVETSLPQTYFKFSTEETSSREAGVNLFLFKSSLNTLWRSSRGICEATDHCPSVKESLLLTKADRHKLNSVGGHPETVVETGCSGLYIIFGVWRKT